MNVFALPRTFRTLKHLHWSQLTMRAWRTAQRRLLRPKRLALDAAVHVNPQAFPTPPEFNASCPRGEELVEMLDRGELRLLNQTCSFGSGKWDWRLGQVDEHRLWTVTLHYHQWMYELAKVAVQPSAVGSNAMRLWTESLTDWLESCDYDQPGTQPLAWNSYAIATRLGWSIRSWRLLSDASIQLDPSLENRWRDCLYRQATHLSRNIEWDLRANHLLRDAVGLAWAGRFFDTDRSRRWIETAQRIAVQQAKEQVLDDGSHFELSPFYHLEVMDDWLSLAILLPHAECRQVMCKTWKRSAEYAAWLCHPDGKVAQFNDGAAIDATATLAHGKAIGEGTSITPCQGGRHFPDSGLAVWRGEPWTIFWDVGDVGPDCQPGHAHADTLNIECSFKGQRLFVDPGCYSYDNNENRRYDRATRSHNTVCVDGTDSSEVWHIFRVGRRARPSDVQIHFDDTGLTGTATHDGYRHLAGSPTHRRQIQMDRDQKILISDSITGTGEHEVEGGWLLDPRWTATAVADGWTLSSGEETLQLKISSQQTLQLAMQPSPYHPDYGVEIQTIRLSWQYSGSLPLHVRCEVSP